MSSLLQNEKSTCKCSLLKSAKRVKELDIRGKEDSDILFLMTGPHMRRVMNIFGAFILQHGYSTENSAFLNAAGCVHEDFAYPDSSKPFITCKEHNIKKRIHKINPKVIVAEGLALYTIVEGTNIRPKYFYNYETFKPFFYSPEFNCWVLPIPSIKDWIGITRYKKDLHTLNNFPRHFTDRQIKSIKYVRERAITRTKTNCVLVEDPFQFFREHKGVTIEKIAVDIETTGLKYFKSDIISIQVCLDGETGYFIPWQNTDNFKQELDELLSRCPYQIYANCLEGKTKILMEDGTTETIANIVNKKIDKRVMSYDSNGKMIPKKIISYFKNGKNQGYWYEIQINTKINRGNYPKLYITGEHKIYTKRGKLLVRDLKEDDILLYKFGLNGDMKDFITGSFLGDGSFNKKEDSYTIHLGHCEKQKDYLCFKKKYIEDCGFKTTKIGVEYRDNQTPFYRFSSVLGGNLKYLYKDLNFSDILNNLNLKSLAIWYMDDGSVSNKSSIIWCRRFSKELTYKFIDKINSLLGGTYCYLKKYSNNLGINKYEVDGINFTREGTRILCSKISPYCIKSLSYKLVDVSLNEVGTYSWDTYKTSGDVSIVEINKINAREKLTSKFMYDLEVEDTHNYIANGIKVSNSIFDLKFLKDNGINNVHVDYDVNYAGHFAYSSRGNSLKANAFYHTDLGGYDTELDKYIRKYNIRNYAHIPRDTLGNYAAMDTIVTYRLEGILSGFMNERQRNLFFKTYLPLVNLFVGIELRGIHVDRSYLRAFRYDCIKRMGEIVRKIKREVGGNINLDSDKQLGDMFQKLGAKGYEKTKANRYRTNEDILLTWKADGIKYVDEILEYKKLSKMVSSYLSEESPGAILSGYTEEDGRIHPNFNFQFNYVGRLSCSSPSVQTLPIKSNKDFRPIFKAPDGYYLAEVDFSGFHLRLVAIASEDDAMKEMFTSEVRDLHSKTAAAIFTDLTIEDFLYKMKHGTKEEQEKFKEYRFMSKAINFGLIYGMAYATLAKTILLKPPPDGWSKEKVDEYLKVTKIDDVLNYLDMKPSQKVSPELFIRLKYEACAKEIRHRFFNQYPGVNKWIENCHRNGKQKGYVDTFYGFRIWLPELLHSSYEGHESHMANLKNIAVNGAIIGTEANIMDRAMLQIDQYFKNNKLDARIVNQVHDSLLIEFREDLLDIIRDPIMSIMIRDYPEYKGIPIDAEGNYGKIWGGADRYKWNLWFDSAKN